MPSNTAPPASYASLDFKNLAITNVPADHPTPAGVVVVALNRPDKLNTMTGDMLHELERAYRLFHVDDRVRAIVLTGQGESFCAGVDLSGELGRLQDQKGSNEDKFRDLYATPFAAICVSLVD